MGKVSLRIVATRACDFCGEPIGLTRRQIRENKRFCNKTCSGQFQRLQPSKNLHVRMNEAKKHWTTALATRTELELLKVA